MYVCLSGEGEDGVTAEPPPAKVVEDPSGVLPRELDADLRMQAAGRHEPHEGGEVLGVRPVAASVVEGDDRRADGVVDPVEEVERDRLAARLTEPDHEPVRPRLAPRDDERLSADGLEHKVVAPR